MRGVQACCQNAGRSQWHKAVQPRTSLKNQWQTRRFSPKWQRASFAPPAQFVLGFDFDLNVGFNECHKTPPTPYGKDYTCALVFDMADITCFCDWDHTVGRENLTFHENLVAGVPAALEPLVSRTSSVQIWQKFSLTRGSDLVIKCFNTGARAFPVLLLSSPERGSIMHRTSRLTGKRSSHSRRSICIHPVYIHAPLSTDLVRYPHPRNRLALASRATWSKATFGTVSGILTDPSGAIVQGAKVTLVDEQKGYQFTAISDANGRYLFASIPPGMYSVSAEMAGI